MPSEHSDSGFPRREKLFATTHWSVVLAVGEEDTPESATALEQLCHTYWLPLYAYVRRRGYSAEDSQDLTQQFFARFLERDSFSLADPARGRFRTFLLTSLQHFLADEWRRAHSTKRGAGAIEFSLDGAVAEARWGAELTDTTTPERAYEEHWALTLLEKVMDGMRTDYDRAGKGGLFERLRDSLWGPDPSVSYEALAKDLGLTQGGVRAALHRLRGQFRRRLRKEVAHTVGAPEEVEAELRHLINVIGPGAV